MNCLIIDDEELARKLLRDYVSKVNGLECGGDFKNAIDAQGWLQRNSADLLFLDINMPGMNGLAFLKTITRKPMVILTTAYTEYALEGFELDVIDYLVKPFSFERFFKAVNKAMEYHAHQQHPPAEFEKPPYFFVKSDYKIIKIDFDDVIFVEGFREYVRIHTKDKKIITLLSMSKIADALPVRRFLRVHRSFIIHIDKIRSVGNAGIEMEGQIVPVGASYKQKLLDVLQERGLF